MGELTILDTLNGRSRPDIQPVLVEEKPEDIAHQILVKSNISAPPIDIFKISNDLHLKLYEENLHEDGYLLKSNENEGIIFFRGPSFQRGLRWKFTVAHEIGHWVLELLTNSGNKSRGTTLEHVETWCNRFASELLVPAKFLRNVVGETPLTYQEFDRIRSLFDISEDVLINKLYTALKIEVVSVKKRGDEFVITKRKGENNRVDLTHFKSIINSGLNGEYSGKMSETHALIGPEIVITRTGKLNRYFLVS